MKTLKKIALVTFILFTVSTYGVEHESHKSKNPIAMTMLEFNNVRKGQQILVKDDYGKTIYSETIHSSGDYSKIYDLTAFKDGLYTIELNKDYEIIVKPFEIRAHQVRFFPELEKIIFKPVIRQKDNMLMISKLSFSNDPLHIEIYYENELIHSEKLTGTTIIDRIYSFSKLKKGSYYTIVRADDRSYIQDFKL